MKKRMILPYTITTALLMISCSNNKQEPKEKSPGDTIFINDLHQYPPEPHIKKRMREECQLSYKIKKRWLTYM